MRKSTDGVWDVILYPIVFRLKVWKDLGVRSKWTVFGQVERYLFCIEDLVGVKTHFVRSHVEGFSIIRFRELNTYFSKSGSGTVKTIVFRPHFWETYWVLVSRFTHRRREMHGRTGLRLLTSYHNGKIPWYRWVVVVFGNLQNQSEFLRVYTYVLQ